MKIEELEKIVRLSWDKDTCYSKDDFDDNNPSLGQCAVTSLIVNDFLGGRIMRCMMKSGSHYYNIVNNKIIDLTVEQFKGIIPNYELGEERTREYLLSNENTKARYLRLLKNVKDNFIKYGEKDYKLIDEKGSEFISKIPGTLGGNKKLKIYGKLDCKCALRYIEKGYYVKNRVFFEDEDIATKAGYRPCGVCMKKEYQIWKKEKK